MWKENLVKRESLFFSQSLGLSFSYAPRNKRSWHKIATLKILPMPPLETLVTVTFFPEAYYEARDE